MKYNKWNKWLRLYPSGKELKKLIDRQRRIEYKELLQWDGGNGPWHPEGARMLLHSHIIPVKRRRKKSRKTAK